MNKEFLAMTDSDNINYVVGVKMFDYGHHDRLANYRPKKMKRGLSIVAYFSAPNTIGLSGVMFEDNKIKRFDNANDWACFLSHEYLHYILFKYISKRADEHFDRIVPKACFYGLDGMSPNKKCKKHIKRYNEERRKKSFLEKRGYEVNKI